MRCLLASLFLSILIALAPSARAQNADIAAQDLRLARIADALLIGNVRLCRNTMPVTGMILHSLDQYGEGAEPFFTNGPLSITAIVPGSAAELAGLQANDGIVSINGIPITSMRLDGDSHLREVAFFTLSDIGPDDPLELSISRDGNIHELRFEAPTGCRALVEILVGDDFNARSDGRVIQVRFDFGASLSDEQLAVIVAHELAHSVLEHRRRKVEGGIDNVSILRHLGRNQRVNRQAEIEADRLSAHLLANGGYDPIIAPQFWRSAEGLIAGGGALPSFIYPTQTARADMIEQEIARYLVSRRGPTWPGHLLGRRDQTFASD